MRRISLIFAAFALTLVANAGTIVPARTGNGPTLTGTATANNCVKFADTSGNIADSGSACGGAGTVTTTGTPANGNLTKFSGATSITNGDLSGDCTTSGALAITCTKTSGVAFTSAATTATGTSGATIPLLNGANTHSGATTFSSTISSTVAGAASTPGVTVSGVPFAGTGTTSFPQVYINVSGATASTTLNTAGTALGVNGHGAIDLVNFLEDGTSQFKVNSTGTATVATAVSAPTVTGTSTVQFGSAFKNSNNTHILMSATAPTIASGFGTSPSVVANNGTAAFTINVGTGGTASSGVVTMPAATTGWACVVAPNAAPQAGAEMFSAPTSTTSITITNYTASTAVALAWPASAVLQVTCIGY